MNFDRTFFGAHEFNRQRLNERCRRIIDPHLAFIQDKEILDLGAHHGVWSWMALKVGARKVTAIEGRAELLNHGHHMFDEFQANSYRTIVGDVFLQMQELINAGELFDTVFCLGLFYHILDHHRLLRQMADLARSAILLDTGLLFTDEWLIRLEFEDTSAIANAIPNQAGHHKRLVGFPSQGALAAMVADIGWKVHEIPWLSEEVDYPDAVKDYLVGQPDLKKRFTYLLLPGA